MAQRFTSNQLQEFFSFWNPLDASRGDELAMFPGFCVKNFYLGFLTLVKHWDHKSRACCSKYLYNKVSTELEFVSHINHNNDPSGLIYKFLRVNGVGKCWGGECCGGQGFEKEGFVAYLVNIIAKFYLINFYSNLFFSGFYLNFFIFFKNNIIY